MHVYVCVCTYVRKYVRTCACLYSDMSLATVDCYFSFAESCPQENDTFAGDYLLQSFQRLAMILANNTECVDGCVRDNFGKVLTHVC